MNIGIYTNIQKDKGLKVTEKLVDVFLKNDFSVYLYKDIANLLNVKNRFDENSEKLFDLLVTVGGDGTMLQIASYCARNKISVIGVNLGKLGFLTEVEVGAVEMLPQMIKEQKFIEERRMLLSLEYGGKEYLALNDVVLSRGSSGKMIAIEVTIDGRLADKYYCDGFIISTPTGSTAYSLSAGGCVLSPNVNAISLVSINSHSLHSRPIVVSSDSAVTVGILNSQANCDIVSDGNKVGQIIVGESVTVRRAVEELSFLRFKDSNFYERLLSKLNTWSVTLN